MEHSGIVFSKQLVYLQNGNGATYTSARQKLKMVFQENKHEVKFLGLKKILAIFEA